MLKRMLSKLGITLMTILACTYLSFAKERSPVISCSKGSCVVNQVNDFNDYNNQTNATEFWCPDNFYISYKGRVPLRLCRSGSCAKVSNNSDILRNDSIEIRGYNQETSNVTICKEFSENFLECPKKYLNVDDYEQLQDGSLKTSENSFIQLGEYFREGDQVIICNPSLEQPSNVTEIKRSCMPFSVSQHDFEILQNGRLFVQPISEVIPREYHSSRNGDGSVNVCYLVSEKFSTCTLVDIGNVTLSPSMSLTDLDTKVTYDVGDYFLALNGSAARVCKHPNPKNLSGVQLAYGVMATISCVFLLLLMLIHLFLPCMNLHRMALLCLTFSMFIMYGALAIRFFNGDSLTGPMNYAHFVLQYIFALASFFWLNVLAYDLWHLIANINVILDPNSISSIKRAFFLRCVYAWGIPSLLCSLVLYLDSRKDLQYLVGIKIGVTTTGWFENSRTNLIFFFGPMIPIFINNTVFFVLTILNLRKASQEMHVNKQIFIVFAKLFVIMGLSWFFEILSFFFYNQVPKETWYLTDAFNLLQGVMIFIIYVSKISDFNAIATGLKHVISSYPISRTSKNNGTICFKRIVLPLHIQSKEKDHEAHQVFPNQ